MEPNTPRNAIALKGRTTVDENKRAVSKPRRGVILIARQMKQMHSNVFSDQSPVTSRRSPGMEIRKVKLLDLVFIIILSN